MQQLTTVLETNSDKFKLQKPATSTHKMRNLFKGFRKDKQELSRTHVTTSAVPVITQALAGFHIASPTSMTVRASTSSDLSQLDDFCIKFQEAMTDCIGRSLLGSWRGPTRNGTVFPLRHRRRSARLNPSPISLGGSPRSPFCDHYLARCW